ncbi:DNA repair protein RadC [Actinomadura sp. KC216]|uniref:JAB domain-containing protein n=1 Tax=Actinomadura sp. KC216 TaxID=2530370 RepID=UPI00104ACB95|nr:DNA repair protein RadC [Actinomadura sp. KC216]TDB86552.1 DNA repair protein RadC [Actinomadura sp. KC216]
MRVTDLPELDRPRERLLKLGPGALSNRELLALILGAGSPGCDAIELAAQMITSQAGLVSLAGADPHALTRLMGIGPAKAARVAAAFELGRRSKQEPAITRIQGSADLAAAARPLLSGLRYERVVLVACNPAGKLIRALPLTEGAADHCLVPIKEALTAVLSCGGSQFGIAHNHPSGALDPSPADIQVTSQIKRAAEVVGLRFLDHLIIAGNGWRRVPLDRHSTPGPLWA